jgi:hypothetical protein
MDAQRPGGSVHHRELMDDIEEWTGRSLLERAKRQVVVAAMAVGAALSYFVPKWFKTDYADQVDSRAVYESLAKRVAESHKTVIQLTTSVPLIEQHFQYSMDSVFDLFMNKVTRLGNQSADLMNSMKTGELRMALIATNTVQEMNCFSQFFLYSCTSMLVEQLNLAREKANGKCGWPHFCTFDIS